MADPRTIVASIIVETQTSVIARPDRTRAVARGVSRFLRSAGFAVVQEMTFANGRRADVVGLGSDNQILVIEIKSGIADFRTDQKWTDYRDFCDKLFFAVDADFPVNVLDPDVGVIMADGYGAELLRDAPLHKLAPARRRALTIAFAQLAAQRLELLRDPDGATVR